LSSYTQPKYWAGNWSKPTKFRKKVSFACRISGCKWLCGRFQGGRRKSILAWLEVVALPEVGEKREKVRPAEGEEKSGKKDDFLPKFHTDFFLFGE
jgi:hypothetical protein